MRYESSASDTRGSVYGKSKAPTSRRGAAGASKRDRRIADRACRPPPLRQKAPGTDTAKAGDGM